MRLIDSTHQANKLISALQKVFDDLIVHTGKSLSIYSANAIPDLLLGRNETSEPNAIGYV